MKGLLIILILLVACGEKETAPPLKANERQEQLEVSPKGIIQIQKLFNLYSSSGKLSLLEIQNIAQKISPQLSSYLERINLQMPKKKKLNATEFFKLLSESNKAIYWALNYNLQTQEGWNKVLKEEFSWSDEGLLEETRALMAKLLKKQKSPLGQEIFIEKTLKIGGAFNFLDAIELAPGTILDAITKRIIFNSSKEDLPELTYETLRLAKLTFLLRYTLLDSKLESLKNLPKDRFANWSLNSIEGLLIKNYPGLTKDRLTLLLHETNIEILNKEKKSKKDNYTENVHKTLHPKAYSKLGTSPSIEIQTLSAYDLYLVIQSNCKQNKLPTNLDKWIDTFDSIIVNLNYTEPGFCEEIKDIVPQNHAAD